MKLIKKILGIKEYLTCPTCSMVYEPKGGPFDDWCPEHRKPYVAQYELEQWAMGWARRNPEEARKTRMIDDIESHKQGTSYSQHLGAAMAQSGSVGGLYQKNWPFGGLGR